MAPLWNRIGESFGGALNGMITGAQTWRSALASIFQQVADAFLQQIVIQPFQQWIAMQARMLALKLGFIQQEQTVDAAASAAKVAQKTTETTAAAGGLVPEVKVPPAQPQMNQAVRIVNAVDPGVTHDHLQSPAGEKVIVNIIGRNARAIRAALQG